CWNLDPAILSRQNRLQNLTYTIVSCKNNCRVHVHNVQVCYICILVPCWCAAPINSSLPRNSKFLSV
uniref:Uncharacterized protein n=1 Tax=Macaca fascicularis TaxID=9541 RepID=A0A7N9CX85_MACFA